LLLCLGSITNEHIVYKLEALDKKLELKLEETNEKLYEKLEETNEKLEETKTEVHTVALNMHVMNEKLPKITEVLITPSKYNKSKHKETFMDVMDMLGFGREAMVNRITSQYDPSSLPNRGNFNFSFDWKQQDEAASYYEPLLKHLSDNGIFAQRVDAGQGLPDGLLYREELFTLKKNTSLRSCDLRKSGEEPVFRYILAGRTDLVAKFNQDEPLGKFNNEYFIEVKRVSDFVEEDALREATLQLIGGNASNSFHSPPALLTNLNKMHYVLFISLEGDPTVELHFKLNVIHLTTFGDALDYVEKLTTRKKSCTLHLARRPTPDTSPMKAAGDQDSMEQDITERFQNVSLEEATSESSDNCFFVF
jgi:hypothetical protein